MHVLALPQLAWVALADNPFLRRNNNNKNDASGSNLPVLGHFPEQKGEILGQGAGGITRKVDLPDGTTVAVKTAAAGMTSDGAAASERHMAVRLARHDLPAMVRVLGQTAASNSLVMEYLDHYTVLANPPSLVTCTRDVYDSQQQWRWTFAQAEHVVTTLLLTLQGMHATASICHGDFYSHNVMIRHNDETSNDDAPLPPDVRLCDLGAAFEYDRHAPYGKLVERVEVRAFQIWVAEMNQYYVQERSLLLQQLADASHVESFDDLLVKWRKLQLTAMAKSFDPDVVQHAQEEKVEEKKD